MQYCFMLLTNEERKDPTKFGYNYAKTRESDWITMDNDVGEYMSGAVKGVDYLFYNNKSYMIHKRYLDLAGKKVIVICTESPSSCDTRTEF